MGEQEEIQIATAGSKIVEISQLGMVEGFAKATALSVGLVVIVAEMLLYTAMGEPPCCELKEDLDVVSTMPCIGNGNYFLKERNATVCPRVTSRHETHVRY